MGDQFPREQFGAAVSRMERIATVGRLALLAVALVHLLTLSPYLARSQSRRAVDGAALAASAAARELTDLSGALAEHAVSIEAAVSEPLQETLHELVAAFEALQRRVAAANPRFASGHEEEPRDSPIQGPPQTRADVVALPPFPAELEAPIRDAAEVATLVEALRGYIGENLITPAFASLNERWSQEAAPVLAEETDALLERLGRSRGDFPSFAPPIARTEEVVRSSRAAVAAVRFEPPGGKDWWRSVANKERALSEIGQGVSRSLGARDIQRFLAAGGEWDRARTQVAAESERLQKEREALEAEIARLQKTFEEQSKRITGLAKPFEFVPMDLAFIIANLPLLIGLLCGALQGVGAIHLPEAAWAAARIRTDGDDSAASWIDSHRIDNRSGWARVVPLPGWIAVAWVVGAGIQLGVFEAAEPAAILTSTILGLVAIAAGLAVRARAAARARDWLGTQA